MHWLSKEKVFREHPHRRPNHKRITDLSLSQSLRATSKLARVEA